MRLSQQNGRFPTFNGQAPYPFEIWQFAAYPDSDIVYFVISG